MRSTKPKLISEKAFHIPSKTEKDNDKCLNYTVICIMSDGMETGTFVNSTTLRKLK